VCLGILRTAANTPQPGEIECAFFNDPLQARGLEIIPFDPADFFQCDSLSVRLTREDEAGTREVCVCMCIDLVDARAPFEPNRRRGYGEGF
jgi:hypothetical protein